MRQPESAYNPLAELVLDAREFDRARIVEALRGRLALDRSTSMPFVLPQFLELNNVQKILALLMARKAAVLLGLAEDDASTPALIADQTGIPAGTIRRLLRELLDAHKVSQGRDGRYSLNGPQVSIAVDSLSATPNTRQSTLPSQSHAKVSRAHRGPRQTILRQGDTVEESSKMTNTSVRRRGRRSTTALVKELVEAGFLSVPRTLADIQRQLKDKTGHQIPLTTLSPVFTRMLRSHVLDREQTADGVYAYVARKG